MFKRVLIALAVLGLVAPVMVSSPASAGYNVGCATQREWNTLRVGNRFAIVANRLGTSGERVFWTRSDGAAHNSLLDTWQDYRPCGYVNDWIEINFDDYSHGDQYRGGALRVYEGTWTHYCLNSVDSADYTEYYCYDAGWTGWYPYDSSNERRRAGDPSGPSITKHFGGTGK